MILVFDDQVDVGFQTDAKERGSQRAASRIIAEVGDVFLVGEDPPEMGICSWEY